MPHYFKLRDYVSERALKNWPECYRDEQRSINFDIRLEYYAKRQNSKQFVKMIEKWANGFKFPYAGLPTLTMMKYAKLALRYFNDRNQLGSTINKMIEEHLLLTKRLEMS